MKQHAVLAYLENKQLNTVVQDRGEEYYQTIPKSPSTIGKHGSPNLSAHGGEALAIQSHINAMPTDLNVLQAIVRGAGILIRFAVCTMRIKDLSIIVMISFYFKSGS